jgi:chaperonin GroES
MQVKPGDKVVFSEYAGSKVKMDNEEVIILRQSDILAIVE